MHILSTLAETIARRAAVAPDRSWTARLLQKGRSYIVRKVGEEAVEVVIAGVENDKSEVIKESADLLYHLSVLWHDMNISVEDIADELKQRQHQSGIQEKENR